jgi:hypothetical protein
MLLMAWDSSPPRQLLDEPVYQAGPKTADWACGSEVFDEERVETKACLGRPKATELEMAAAAGAAVAALEFHARARKQKGLLRATLRSGPALAPAEIVKPTRWVIRQAESDVGEYWRAMMQCFQRALRIFVALVFVGDTERCR